VTDVTGTEGKDHKGRFAPGNRYGKGRARQRPLRDVCSFEDEAELWRLHCALALTDAPAREFILRHLAGNPPQAAPELPPIAWKPVTCLADLLGAVNAMFGAQAAGEIDAAGMKFLAGIILDLAKVFEVVELGPEIKRIKERLDEREAVGA
jgi:hypothetical protein